MAKPRSFSFSIKDGDPLRLATAMRDIVGALDPLTDAECGDVLGAIGDMYKSPDLAAQLLTALEGIVSNHDNGDRVDESWWQAGRNAIDAAGGRRHHG